MGRHARTRGMGRQGEEATDGMGRQEGETAGRRCATIASVEVRAAEVVCVTIAGRRCATTGSLGGLWMTGVGRLLLGRVTMTAGRRCAVATSSRVGRPVAMIVAALIGRVATIVAPRSEAAASSLVASVAMTVGRLLAVTMIAALRCVVRASSRTVSWPVVRR